MTQYLPTSPAYRPRNGALGGGFLWRLRRTRWSARRLVSHWVQRAIDARYGYRGPDAERLARDEDGVADILIFSLSGLALSLLAIERFPALAAAIAWAA